MLKLIIGNKAYSSWSLRGWLAVKQSGLPFEEITVPMFDEDWHKRREDDEFAPSAGKVPILWDDEIVVWDSLAIVEYLADKTDRARFWPTISAPAAWRARWRRRCTLRSRISAASTA
jgi:glutathione S-transferase